MRFDHIGIVVREMEEQVAYFDALNGPLVWTALLEEPIQKVWIRFGRAPEGHVYELLQPFDETSPVFASLKSQRNIIHHMCYRVPDLASTAEELRDAGAVPTAAPAPGVAFGGAQLQFFFQPNGWLIEIVEGETSPFDLFPA